MLDQLRTHLSEHNDGDTTLPQEWQFVTIDVPVEAEDGPNGLPNVEESGGAYVSTGSRSTYSEFDRGLSNHLGSPANRALGEIATWASKRPEKSMVPIDKGAGQYRGIGRMLTIQNLRKIREQLDAAVKRLNNTPGDNSEPLVFVVSSMAGGAGASMFLDITRLLTTIQGVQAQNVVAFMYTPEVFEALPNQARVGQWPNSLAMFGEAVAAQFGAGAEHDARLYRAMGINETIRDVTVGRIIPIGARMGENGAQFGDGTPGSVYRGIGRALAALMTSPAALNPFKQFVIGNPGNIEVDQNLFGWGVDDIDAIPWGSFGYAQLSLGRDRYAEYSAQRLAYATFDRLLRGHVDPTKIGQSGSDQLEGLVRDNIDHIVEDLRIPSFKFTGDAALNNTFHWLGQEFQTGVNEAVGQMTNRLHQRLPGNGDGQRQEDWRAQIEAALHDPRLYSVVDDIAGAGAPTRRQIDEGGNVSYRAVYRWADEFADRVTGELEKQLSRYGLSYVNKLVDNLRDALTANLIPSLQQIEQWGNSMNPMAVPSEVSSLLQPLTGRGTVSNSQEIINRVVQTYHSNFTNFFIGRLAGQLAAVLADFDKNAMSKLTQQLQSIHRLLDDADRAPVENSKLSDVATDEPAAWPKHAEVPDRFQGSANEIVVSRVDEFSSTFNDQIVSVAREKDQQVTDPNTAVQVAATEVLLGQWDDSQSSEKAPNNTFAPQLPDGVTNGNRMGWISSLLVVDPMNSSAERRNPRPAHFQFALRPADLLERARQWIRRPNFEFQDYINMDLRGYLNEHDRMNANVDEIQMRDRRERLTAAFREAIANARPLVGVNTAVINAAYSNTSGRADITLSFSELPFADMADVQNLLRSVIIDDTSLDQGSTIQSFDADATQTKASGVHRIEVFGSYPGYAPIVFSSLLPTISKDWASRGSNRATFWQLRRARPLASSLPITNAERRALVAGWLMGKAMKRIDVQNPESPLATAHIYSDYDNKWYSFPSQLLTPPSDFAATYDWMPAVIESILLAYADTHNVLSGGVTTSLLPYRVLREIYDTGAIKPTNAAGQMHSAETHFARWIRHGRGPEETQDDTSTSPQQRYDAVKLYLQQHLALAQNFIPTNVGGYHPGAQSRDTSWSDVTSRETAKNMPLYRDLAEDVAEVVPTLLRQLDSALARAQDESDQLLMPPPNRGQRSATPEFGAVPSSDLPSTPPSFGATTPPAMPGGGGLI